MIDLKETVRNCTKSLNELSTSLDTDSAVFMAKFIPADCIDEWKSLSKYYHELEKTIVLFDARNFSLKGMMAIVTEDNKDPRVNPHYLENKIIYNDSATDFFIARHCAVLSYVTITWSIYDRLANVCGRLSGCDDLSKNVSVNPKCDDFLDHKKLKLGFNSQKIIKKSYEWPMRLSYQIRNWMVHEGCDCGEIKLFRGDTIDDGLIISEEASKYLIKRCGWEEFDKISSNCCIQGAWSKYETKDLILILLEYNQEIDYFFCWYLDWCVKSFENMFKMFMQSRST